MRHYECIMISIDVSDKRATFILRLKIMPTGVSETWYMSTKWYGVTFQKTVVFVVIAVRTSYFKKQTVVYVTQHTGFVSFTTLKIVTL